MKKLSVILLCALLTACQSGSDDSSTRGTSTDDSVTGVSLVQGLQSGEAELTQPSITDAPDTFDVYIIAGQSNTDGRGEVRDLSTAQLASVQNDAIISFLNPGSERERAVPTSNPNDLDVGTNGFMNLVPGGFSVDGTSARLLTDTFGPELSFGASIAEATGTSNRIAIIKVSRGGTNLRNDWRVNSTVDSGPDEPEGFLYRALLEEVNDRLADLRADGSTANVMGFVWHQGESDSNNGVNQYVERYIEFVENVRDEFGENIPFAVGELSRDRISTQGENLSETFNANLAQLVADSADPNNLDVPSDIFLVSSLGLETPRSLDPNNFATDGTHFTANGQLELGRRYASSIGNAIAQTVNLSQGKSVSQSSTRHGGSASRAVDGNTNGIFRSSSTTHTATEAQPWWQVDLESIRHITHVNLYNRTDDCCRFRLSDFYVLISDTPFTSDSLSSNLSNPDVDSFYYGPIAGDPTRIDINGNGRYVRVQLVGNTNPLSLAEVEVFGR